MAQKALKNAKGAPYTRVEVSIEAPAVTRAQARKAFAKVDPSTITDGASVSRVRVWCKDGVYEPTSSHRRRSRHMWTIPVTSPRSPRVTLVDADQPDPYVSCRPPA